MVISPKIMSEAAPLDEHHIGSAVVVVRDPAICKVEKVDVARLLMSLA